MRRTKTKTPKCCSENDEQLGKKTKTKTKKRIVPILIAADRDELLLCTVLTRSLVCMFMFFLRFCFISCMCSVCMCAHTDENAMDACVCVCVNNRKLIKYHVNQKNKRISNIRTMCVCGQMLHSNFLLNRGDALRVVGS